MPVDDVIVRGGPVSVPLDYVVPTGTEIVPRTVSALLNGAAAGGAFVPVLEVIAPSGAVTAYCARRVDIAAGASVLVSWFPGVAEADDLGSSSGSSGGTVDTISSPQGTLTVNNPTGPSVNVDLIQTGVTAGSYGDASHVPQVTVDAQGRLTAATVAAVAGGPPTGAAGGNLAGIYPNPTVADVGILTTKGDLLVRPVAAPATRLPVGSDGLVLVADSTTAPGVKWAAASGATVQEYDYVERTTALALSATTPATANTVITGNAITLDGATDILVEFFCPFGDASLGAALVVDLWDGASDIMRLGGLGIAAGNNPGDSLYCAEFLRGARRPSNAVHSYSVRAWRTAGAANLNAGAGNGPDVPGPIWYRVTKV